MAATKRMWFIHLLPLLIIMKAGIAAVNLLSDFVNYKLPLANGSATVSTPCNSMVDCTKQISNTRSTNVKTSRKDTVYVNSSAWTASGSNFTNASYGTKVVADESILNKGVNILSCNGSGNFMETDGISSETRDQKKSVPQRSKAHANRIVPNNKQRGKFVGNTSEGFNRSVREAKVTAGAPVVRLYSNSGHVLESVLRILRQFKWSLAAEDALSKLDCSLDAYQANQILKQLQDFNVALGFFYWLKRHPGFKHDGHTYTTMVGILGRSRQFGAINKLLNQMVGDGCQPNIVTYNRLIHSYGGANYLKEDMGVFNQLQNMGCKPDRVTFCTLIDIHAKAGFLDVAIDMYQRMQEAGLSPDTFTYSVIINCLGKAGHLAEAHQLFYEMVNQGCVPNLVTFNIMIALQAKARNYDGALQLYREMQSAGFEPDKVTYSIYHNRLGSTKQGDRCLHGEAGSARIAGNVSFPVLYRKRLYWVLYRMCRASESMVASILCRADASVVSLN